VLVLGVKWTLTAELVRVTSPPPIVEYTMPPSTVLTGVASAGALGGTTTVVSRGTVVAVICEDSSDVIADCWFDAVVVLLDCRFMAMCTSFVAMAGDSEWTCSRAERSAEKTPS
jgi:hypothetical protein